MAKLTDRILVAVGIVVDADRKVLMAQRNAVQHQAHAWEFPGGKVESGETVPQALKRELFEEVGIIVKSHKPLLELPYDYPDKKVHLSVHLVNTFEGEAQGLENQLIRWVTPTEMTQLKVPLANEHIVDHLCQLYKMNG